MIRFPQRAFRWCASLCLAFGALVAFGATPATAANPLGYVILQGEGQCALASVDLVTGATEEIGSETADKCAFDLEFSPDGSRLLGTRIDEGAELGTAVLVEFDLTTGAVTTLSDLGDFPIGGPGSAQGNLTFTPTGSLYTYLVPGTLPPDPTATAVDPACDGSAFCLFQVDLADPTDLTYVNHVPQEFTVYYGLATSCAGVTTSARRPDIGVEAPGIDAAAWGDVGAAAPGDQILTSVNVTSTGPATTDIGPLTDTFITSLDYTTAGTLYGVGFGAESSAASLFTINPSTGAPTEVSGLTLGGDPLGLGVLGFAIAHPCAAPVPPTPPTAAPAAVVTPRFTG